MEDQVKSSYLPEMPVLVIENILSYIPHLSNVALTCKVLYEIVCGMEKHRRVLHISGTYDGATSFGASRLSIEDDTVFDSIMNSPRTIQQIRLRGDREYLRLNERQLPRLTAIMKQFGANITSLELNGFVLTASTIFGLLQQTPKLESLKFANAGEIENAMEEKTLDQLSNLKTLELTNCTGVFDISNLIPAGSLNHFRSCSAQSTKVIQNILTKQHNLKSLHLDGYFDRTILFVDHMQLETLILGSHVRYTYDDLVRILQCHRNLKELRILSPLSVRGFKWICNNLNELEVVEVNLDKKLAIGDNRNVFEMLGEMKKLRHFRTHGSRYLTNYLFQCESLEKLDILYRSFCDGGLFKRVIHSMVQSFCNLTDLEMKLDNFATLSCVLRQCITLTSLSTTIKDPSPHQFDQQRFPNIQHLTLSTVETVKRNEISQSISGLVHTVPNLKKLSMPSSNPIFNVNLMKDFLSGSKSLDYFFVDCFELQADFCAEDIVTIIQRLSEQLRGFQLTFKAEGQLHSQLTKAFMSNEFIDRYGVVDEDGSSRFCLHKRDGKL